MHALLHYRRLPQRLHVQRQRRVPQRCRLQHLQLPDHLRDLCTQQQLLQGGCRAAPALPASRSLLLLLPLCARKLCPSNQGGPLVALEAPPLTQHASFLPRTHPQTAGLQPCKAVPRRLHLHEQPVPGSSGPPHPAGQPQDGLPAHALSSSPCPAARPCPAAPAAACPRRGALHGSCCLPRGPGCPPAHGAAITI